MRVISLHTTLLNGYEALRLDSFGPMSLRYARPSFLRVIAPGNIVWLEWLKGADGHYYYLTRSLRVGEVFRVARASSRQREPFYGRLLARDEDTLVVGEISAEEFQANR